MSDLPGEEDMIYPNPRNNDPLFQCSSGNWEKKKMPKGSRTIVGWMGTNIIWVTHINPAPELLSLYCTSMMDCHVPSIVWDAFLIAHVIITTWPKRCHCPQPYRWEMGLTEVTNLEFLARMWCSGGLSTAWLDCKVHALITAVVFCSNLGPETVKLLHLLSVCKWETNLHFPSDPKLVWSWVSGAGSVSWLFPPGLSIRSVLSICDWMDGHWSNVRPHDSNHKCHTRYSCTICPGGSTENSVPFTFSWFILRLLLFLWCWRWTSQIQQRANISSFPTEEMKSQWGYNSASVPSEQSKKLCCPVTETWAPPLCHSIQSLRLLKASLICVRELEISKAKIFKCLIALKVTHHVAQGADNLKWDR